MPELLVPVLRFTHTKDFRYGFKRGISATHWYDAGCRLEATDPKSAIAAYERAVAGRPDYAKAHNNLGKLWHDAGALTDAESSYRLAICADPTIALYWFNLGVVVEDQGRIAEAVTAYENTIERSVAGDFREVAADAHYNLARLLDLVGRRTNNKRMLQQAIRHQLQYRKLTK
jgi:tetratricopeptide (TPR) repeat protein